MPALRSKISLAAILIFILLLVLANNVPGPSHLGVTSAHVLSRSPERQWLDYNVTSQGQWVTEQDNVTSSGKWVMGDDNVTSPGKWVIRDDNVTVHVGDTNHPHDFPYLINPEDSCEDNPPFLLILVLSKTSNREQRRAIRDTWGLLQLQRALNFMVRFLLGSTNRAVENVQIHAENFIHGDIIQERFVDTFSNLTLKSIMGLKWATQFCSQAHFVMKIDDDILLHVPNLLEILKNISKKEGNFLLCKRNQERPILRNHMKLSMKLSKYTVNEKDIPGYYFPPYCAGFAYVMNQGAAKVLYHYALRTPYFYIEDVFLTGFCREKAGVNVIGHPGIIISPKITNDSCDFSASRVTSHEIEVKEMRELWANINTQKFFCPKMIKK